MDRAENVKNLVNDQRSQALSTGQLDRYWASPFGQLRLKRRQQLFREPFAAEKNVLEIGTGTGVIAKGFEGSDTFLVSGELNTFLLEHGVGLGNLKRDQVLSLDAHSLPFADNTFDGCFGNAILHHLDPVVALKEMCRVIKPGKSIIFSEPHMANPMVWAVKNIDWLGKKFEETPGETAYFRKQLADIAVEAGLEEVTVTPYDFCVGPSFLLPLVKGLEKFLERSFFKAVAISLLLKAKKSL